MLSFGQAALNDLVGICSTCLDLCLSGKFALEVTCQATKSSHPGIPDRTFFEP